MPGPKPSGGGMRPRMGGGFNQFSDEIGGEHLQASAMQQVMQQKTAAQQQTTHASGQTSPAKMQQQAMAQQLQQQGEATAAGQQPREPREVGTVGEEIVRMGTDLTTEIRQFFSLNYWLGIKPETDDPEEKAKRQQVHSRWQKLNDEQQQLAKRLYQEEIERKKVEEEQEAQRKQQQEAQKAQALPMPSSPQKGPVGPAGSKKQKAVQKLQQDRQQMRGPSGAN